MARSRNSQVARQQRTTQVTQQVAVQRSYTGPLPEPADLERYDAIVPGMAERLLTTFERQAEHRMALEKHVIYWDVRRANAGLAAAFVFAILLLGAAVLFIMNGQEAVGVAALIGPLVTFGGAFIYGSETRRRERNRKEGG